MPEDVVFVPELPQTTAGSAQGAPLARGDRIGVPASLRTARRVAASLARDRASAA